jgi:hypothetical protein
MYRSKLGECLTYGEWQQWAIQFYKELDGMKLPKNWFERLVKVLGLEAC